MPPPPQLPSKESNLDYHFVIVTARGASVLEMNNLSDFVLATNFRYLNESLVKLPNFYLLGLVSSIIRVSIRTKSCDLC